MPFLPGSIGLDAGAADHVAPAFPLRRDEAAEFLWRAGRGHGAFRLQPGLQLLPFQDAGAFRV